MPSPGFEPAILATKKPRPAPYTARPAGPALGIITGTKYPDQLRNYQLLNKDFSHEYSSKGNRKMWS
jgi:hypothetical protein